MCFTIIAINALVWLEIVEFRYGAQGESDRSIRIAYFSSQPNLTCGICSAQGRSERSTKMVTPPQNLTSSVIYPVLKAGVTARQEIFTLPQKPNLTCGMYRAQRGSDRPTEDAYSSSELNPTSRTASGPCKLHFLFCISIRIYEVVDCSIYYLFHYNRGSCLHST
jgi:hypothetical protein